MLGKKIGFVRRVANKIRVRGCTTTQSLGYECLLTSGLDDKKQVHTPRGCIALYVGEERQRFVVQTNHLSHPLFQMLLEKTAEEFGFDQKDRLLVPCSVDVFQEIVSAVNCNKGEFDLRYFVS